MRTYGADGEYFRCDNCDTSCEARFISPISVPKASGWLQFELQPWERWRAPVGKEVGARIDRAIEGAKLDLCRDCGAVLFAVFGDEAAKSPALRSLFQRWDREYK